MIPTVNTPERLRLAREQSGYEGRQAEFAQLIGIGTTTLTRYEKGYSKPKTIVVKAWALATGVPAEWLLTGKTPAGYGDGEALAVGDDVQRARRDSNPQPSDPGTLSRSARPTVVSLDARRDAKRLAASAVAESIEVASA